ncbi:hypothetical protein ACTG15_20765 [Aeromonas sp. 164P]
MKTITEDEPVVASMALPLMGTMPQVRVPQYLVGGSVDYTEGRRCDQPQCHHDLWLWLQLLQIGVIGLMKRLSATRAVFVCGGMSVKQSQTTKAP